MSTDSSRNLEIQVTIGRMDERIKHMDKTLIQSTEAITHQTTILAGIQEVLKSQDVMMNALQDEVRATTQAALDRRVLELEKWRDDLIKETREKASKLEETQKAEEAEVRKATRMEQAKTMVPVGGGLGGLAALLWMIIQKFMESGASVPPPPVP